MVKLLMMDAYHIKAVRVCVCVVPKLKSFMGSLVRWYMEYFNCRLSLSAACGSEFMTIIII